MELGELNFIWILENLHRLYVFPMEWNNQLELQKSAMHQYVIC